MFLLGNSGCLALTGPMTSFPTFELATGTSLKVSSTLLRHYLSISSKTGKVCSLAMISLDLLLTRS
jgi:hypothetical protein